MNETDGHDAGSETDGIDPRQLMKVMSLADVPIFTFIAWLVFEDLVVGVLTGVFVGVGTYLFLDYQLELGDDDESISDVETGPVEARGGFHRGAAGMALSSGGIVMFALHFVWEDVLIGFPAALVLAAASYVTLSQVLPRTPSAAA